MDDYLLVDPMLNAVLGIVVLVLNGFYWVWLPIQITKKIYKTESEANEKVARVTGIWIVSNLALLFFFISNS